MGLIVYTLKSLSLVLLKPLNLIVILALSSIFFYKNTKVSNMQKKISGESVNSPLELTLSQLVLGILGGGLAGVIFNLLGIGFRQDSGIQILFVISILLMFIKPRFGCFSYGGSILGFVSIIYTKVIGTYGVRGPLRVDIIALMTFVGVLHIIEGILVIIDGKKGAIPVFSKRKGMIFGGYALNRYWFIPITMIIFLKPSVICPGSSINLYAPDWWPLIRTPETSILLMSSVIIMMTFFGVLNYHGLTFTRSKIEKTREAGLIIVIYGIIVSIIAQIGRAGLVGEIVILVLVPLLHEVMLNIQRKREKSRKPIFYSFPGRICVIEVVPNSVAYKAGVRPGDIIRKINGNQVKSEHEIYRMKNYVECEVELVIIKKYKEVLIKVEKDLNKGLGILVVPVSVLNKTNFGYVLEEKQKIMREQEENKKRGEE